MTYREQYEWRDIWVTDANDEKRPRVLLVGDSIARSYFGYVEGELRGVYLCARLATSTCVCDPVFEKELALLLDDYRFAVIHFNNGLHGWDYDEPAYGNGLCRVLDFIRQRAPASQLILANTTPFRCNGNPNELDPRNERVRERNRLAQAAAGSRGLAVNDLYAVVLDHPSYFEQDGVHFNPDGQRVLGAQVARMVIGVQERT